MNMPRFTAEACLGERNSRGRNRQEALSQQRGAPQRAVITPQLRTHDDDGGRPYAVCIIDCREQHPGWTAQQCRAACRSTEYTCTPHDNSASRAMCLAGIRGWEAVCAADCANLAGLAWPFGAVAAVVCAYACDKAVEQHECPPAVICT